MGAPLQELQFRRLLVAIDGSGSADLALSAAVTAARRNNASLTLIAVAPDVVGDATRFAMPTPVMPSQEEADAQAQTVLREAVERIPDEIPVTTIMKRGRPGHAIVAASKEANYDAILLGARGVGRMEALIGSVSAYVMHNADLAVIVVHAPREEIAGP